MTSISRIVTNFFEEKKGNMNGLYHDIKYIDRELENDYIDYFIKREKS